MERSIRCAATSSSSRPGPEMLSGKIKTVAFNLQLHRRAAGHRCRCRQRRSPTSTSRRTTRCDRAKRCKTTQFLKTQLDEAKTPARRAGRTAARLHVGAQRRAAAAGRHEPRDARAPEHAASAHQRAADSDARTAPAADGRHSGVGRRCAHRRRPNSPTADLLEQKKTATSASSESRFTSKHPDVLRLKQEIAALEATQGKPTAPTPEDAMAAGQARGRAAVLANLDAELEKQKREEAVGPDARSRPRRSSSSSLPDAPAGLRVDFARPQRRAGDLQLAADAIRRSAGLREHGDGQVRRALPHHGGGDSAGRSERAESGASADDGLHSRAGAGVHRHSRGGAVRHDVSYVDELRQFTEVPVLGVDSAHVSETDDARAAAAAATGCLAAVLFVVVTLSIHMAQDNEQLVRSARQGIGDTSWTLIRRLNSSALTNPASFAAEQYQNLPHEDRAAAADARSSRHRRSPARAPATARPSRRSTWPAHSRVAPLRACC